MIYESVNYTSRPEILMDEIVQTSTAKPTAGTAYQVGDLVKIDPATNTASHSTNGADWHAVIACDVTAEQADMAIATGKDIPVYIDGKLNADVVSIKGTLLDDTQKTAAIGYANTATKIILAKPFVA